MEGLLKNEEILGIIGGGNMARSMTIPLIEKGILPASKIIVSANTSKTLEIWNKLGCKTTLSNEEILKTCHYVIWAVKPQIFPDLCKTFSKPKESRKNTLQISIMAGTKVEEFRKRLECWYEPSTYGAAFVMPSLGLQVSCGSTVFALDELKGLEQEQRDFISGFFSQTGLCLEVPENLINAYAGVAGCGLGFMCVVLEAMSDGAVKMGVPRASSYQFAAQTMKAAGEFILQEGQHPGVIKDNICSPGGTTIAGISELERHGVRFGIIAAIEACTKRAEELNKLK